VEYSRAQRKSGVLALCKGLVCSSAWCHWKLKKNEGEKGDQEILVEKSHRQTEREKRDGRAE
jgi:hypothetical protein